MQKRDVSTDNGGETETKVPVQTIKKTDRSFGTFTDLLCLNLMSVYSNSRWKIKETFSQVQFSQ